MELESGVVEVDLEVVQGDAWPDEPVEFVVTSDGTAPIEDLISSARLQVRTTYGGELLADLDSAELGSALSVLADGSGARVAAAAIDTTDWPVTDVSVARRLREPCRWDLEVTLAATAAPDTIVRGAFTVLAQVTTP